jgi:hypothetical protein
MAVEEKIVKEVQSVSETINDLVAMGQKALKEFESFDQDNVDKNFPFNGISRFRRTYTTSPKWPWKKQIGGVAGVTIESEHTNTLNWVERHNLSLFQQPQLLIQR